MSSKNYIVDRIVNRWAGLKNKKMGPVASFPKILMLELTNACNLKCIMCTNPVMKRRIGTMPLRVATQAIEEASAMGIQEVGLFTTGEPLLYKKLPEVIKKVKDHGLYCYMTSNGLLLNHSKSKVLCESGLDSLKISVDGTNKEEYERIRLGGNFNKLVQNLRVLNEVRRQLNSSMKISISLVSLSENQENILNAQSIFKDLADHVLISHMSNQGGRIIFDDADKYIPPKPERLPCNQLWDRMVLTYDGKLSACCIDFEAEIIYGDISLSSLKNAWNSMVMQKLRRDHLSGNIEEYSLCNQCNYPYLCDSKSLQELNDNSHK